MNELNASLLFGIAAGSANVLGGLMVVSRREPWEPRILHGFVALGAGFMLAAALLAMGPEAVRLTDSAPLLILSGYLVVHLVRSSAMNCVRRFVGALIGGTSGGAARLRGRCRTATGLIYGMMKPGAPAIGHRAEIGRTFVRYAMRPWL